MNIIERTVMYWKNTKSMPFLLRLLCQGAMVAAPILLFFLVVPITEWEINGRIVSYAELWSAGDGASISASLVLVAAGAWGLAARNSMSRWLLVFSPVAPYIVLFIFPWSRSEPIGSEVIVSAVLTAVACYFCLFRLRAVREYLHAESAGA